MGLAVDPDERCTVEDVLENKWVTTLPKNRITQKAVKRALITRIQKMREEKMMEAKSKGEKPARSGHETALPIALPYWKNNLDAPFHFVSAEPAAIIQYKLKEIITKEEFKGELYDMPETHDDLAALMPSKSIGNLNTERLLEAEE